ncbi:hypothetical protein A7K73_00440 [Candidatus Methylacidiphilum fumarolicum]|uniref:Uncharacterized protein n=2 Tax=Candidatus Methylacidiphilum fumarolicum TaxID=591154 RepID=I0JYU1_METFB|nr:hypothetical protein A7K73_00440 [Candidatus Methylacidiphilum fumarolicum]TFE77957.1 hypothetical protein A7D33_00105 [Candidatus Methylacidiphilum fumarolicum]CCG92410.1 conserved hypothetical protein [Methylacidiphilum fumariolicum SolV]
MKKHRNKTRITLKKLNPRSIAMSLFTELRRISQDWSMRIHRAKNILFPQSWGEEKWLEFCKALCLFIQEKGTNWSQDDKLYWDLRCQLHDGGNLVCQVEQDGHEKISLAVVQTGGFVESGQSYVWLLAELGKDGKFLKDPYFVDGIWKEAFLIFLLPRHKQAAFFLSAFKETTSPLSVEPPSEAHNHSSYLID